MFVQFMSPLGFLCLGPLIERWTFIRHDDVECKEVIEPHEEVDLIKYEINCQLIDIRDCNPIQSINPIQNERQNYEPYKLTVQ